MPRDIDRIQVQTLVAQGAQLVDVMPADEYEELHLPGAINIPLKKLAKEADRLDRKGPIITYCYDLQ